MPKVVIVVPCFNEANRLDFESFDQFLTEPGISLLFVNDGSTDETQAYLEDFQSKHPGEVQTLNLEVNSGKAEAVRRGMIQALVSGADITGYLDADLATPARECIRLVDILQQSPPEQLVLIGARVKLLGREIQRSPVRHVLGRIFATAASFSLGVPVYDTQCGAKLFRRCSGLSSALSEPFSSRWVFDVELLGRLIHGGRGTHSMPLSAILEEPLKVWRDVKGSKLGPSAMIKAAIDLIRIRRRLEKW